MEKRPLAEEGPGMVGEESDWETTAQRLSENSVRLCHNSRSVGGQRPKMAAREPFCPHAEELLARLRGDLRGALGRPESWAEVLNGWLRGYPLVARVVEEDGGASIRYEPGPEAGFAGRVLAAVASSIEDGTFFRLKVCPDCRWVFYDKSRSKTRVWCGMYAGEGGRACGTISKVRRYRQRRKAGE